MGCLCSKAGDDDSGNTLVEPLIKEGVVTVSPLVKENGHTNPSTTLPATSPAFKDDNTHSNNSISPNKRRPLDKTNRGSMSSTDTNGTGASITTKDNGALIDITNENKIEALAPAKVNNLINTMNKGTFVFNTKRAFKKVQKHKKGTTRHTLHKQLQSVLQSNSVEMFEIVKLPAGQDRSEWLAVHVVDFFNEVALLFGVIVDECTDQSCPAMTAGRATYLWADGKSVKKPQKVPAHEYVNYLMTWVEEQIASDDLFTSSSTGEISPDVKAVFKRLFRVYAHLYHKHFEHFTDINAESHLNTCFERYIYFCLEFDLIEEKELEPLRELVDRFKFKKESARTSAVE